MWAIVAFLLDADQHALVRKVARYHLAMARCVLQGRSLGTGQPGEPWGVTLKGWDLGDAIPQRPGPNSNPPYSYWSYCLLGIECLLIEKAILAERPDPEAGVFGRMDVRMNKSRELVPPPRISASTCSA